MNKMSNGEWEVEFFYDVVSPFSLLAFEVFQRYCTLGKWNITLHLRPVYLAGVMHLSGNKPPATLPLRAVYLQQDLTRLSSYFQIPLKSPTVFPTQTLQAMRFLTAVQLQEPNMVGRVSRELWRLYWSEDVDISNTSAILQAASRAGVSDENSQKYLAMTNDSSVKDLLKKNTEDAVNRGTFGAPTFFVKPKIEPTSSFKMFFGSDRFPVLSHMTGLPWEGPCPSPSPSPSPSCPFSTKAKY